MFSFHLEKFILISFSFMLIALQGQSQNKTDTVQIYWETGILKYQSICCITDTVLIEFDVEPVIVVNREMRIWDADGKEYTSAIDEFIKKNGDIVEIDAPPCKGEDEQNYRALIAVADSLFEEIDGTDASMNAAISAYVAAKDMIPEASYPKSQLAEIHKLNMSK